MAQDPHPNSICSILALVVLFMRAPSDSESLCSLVQILSENPDLGKYFSIVIYDNSPAEQNSVLESRFPVFYKHDATNAGLPGAYNFALTRAFEDHCEWLLLLDQDTPITHQFVTELIACARTLRNQPQVASIVPKLLVDDKIYSPIAHFIDQLRHQYRRSHAVSKGTVGVQEGRLVAYNSGAALRVAAVRSIGGFPEEYWLDYLDHALFHSLFVRGYHMYVMQAQIAHGASQANVSDVPGWRQRNLLLAQGRFVQQTGNVVDRMLYRIWLLRYSRILWIRHPDKRLWREAIFKALFLKRGTKPASGARGISQDP
jgi:GT2 family glycosyltransferase